MAKKPMLDGKLMFPSEYISAEEFGGKDFTLTIKAVKLDNLRMTDGSTESKPVLFFHKTEKKLVLNKTNATVIAQLHGSEARKWVGKEITLFPTECNAFGQTVDCIRVRPTAPKTQPRPASASKPDPVVAHLTAMLAQTSITQDEIEAAIVMTGLPNDILDGDPIALPLDAGEYKKVVSALITAYVEAKS